jgi:hypothetical protein
MRLKKNGEVGRTNASVVRLSDPAVKSSAGLQAASIGAA